MIQAIQKDLFEACSVIKTKSFLPKDMYSSPPSLKTTCKTSMLLQLNSRDALKHIKESHLCWFCMCLFSNKIPYFCSLINDDVSRLPGASSDSANHTFKKHQAWRWKGSCLLGDNHGFRPLAANEVKAGFVRKNTQARNMLSLARHAIAICAPCFCAPKTLAK